MTLTNAMGSALSGLSAQQLQLDVIGDNLANSSTPGFRTARVDFESALAETIRLGSEPEGSSLGGVNPLQIGTGVEVGGITRTFDVPGVIQPTGVAGDLAIDGQGFFILSDGEGGLAYTRDGSFGVDAAGVFIDPSTGFAVQGLMADPVTGIIPAGAALQDVALPVSDPTFTGFFVQADGTLVGTFTGGNRTIARVELARFVNPEGLERDGQGFFRETPSSGAPVTGDPGAGGLGTLVGGALELSNVDFTEQFGALISAQRAFQSNARVLNRADQLLEDLVKIV
ncbi:MAG TPA: flagellar hook basal-body protein [Planctomycetota bacterium]